MDLSIPERLHLRVRWLALSNAVVSAFLFTPWSKQLFDALPSKEWDDALLRLIGIWFVFSTVMIAVLLVLVLRKRPQPLPRIAILDFFLGGIWIAFLIAVCYFAFLMGMSGL